MSESLYFCFRLNTIPKKEEIISIIQKAFHLTKDQIPSEKDCNVVLKESAPTAIRAEVRIGDSDFLFRLWDPQISLREANKEATLFSFLNIFSSYSDRNQIVAVSKGLVRNLSTQLKSS